MEQVNWEEESKRFDHAADTYDRYRPSYPSELIERINSAANLDPRSAILEIGAGSGKASELFLDKGYELLCIEPGAHLAEVGRSKHRDKKVTFVVTRFEHWDEPEEAFDLVFSATAFHWVPQPVGYAKCAHTLKTNGHLALFWNMYLGEGDSAYNEMVSLCNRHGLVYFQNTEAMNLRIQGIAAEISDSGYFGAPDVYRYPWKITYDTESFIGFLLTGNGLLGKSEKDKADILEQVKQVMAYNGGTITIQLVSTLFLSQKKGE